MNDIPEIVIKDFGNEYVIFRNGEELLTAWDPDDAEYIAGLIFQLEEAKSGLWLIHQNKPREYCKDAFEPDELYDNVHDVAQHLYSMLSWDAGMYEWERSCPECDGIGCKSCNDTGGIRGFRDKVTGEIHEQPVRHEQNK